VVSGTSTSVLWLADQRQFASKQSRMILAIEGDLLTPLQQSVVPVGAMQHRFCVTPCVPNYHDSFGPSLPFSVPIFQLFALNFSTSLSFLMPQFRVRRLACSIFFRNVNVKYTGFIS
jgi:hypothetical protein